jgi:DNA invertase Pin-like site-specific DNA recombinase
MIASVMAALAEFERDLIRERIKSRIAAAKVRGKRLGRQQDSVHRTARRRRSSSWQRVV